MLKKLFSSNPSLLLKYTIGAEAPKAPSITLGNFILIQEANIPP